MRENDAYYAKRKIVTAKWKRGLFNGLIWSENSRSKSEAKDGGNLVFCTVNVSSHRNIYTIQIKEAIIEIFNFLVLP